MTTTPQTLTDTIIRAKREVLSDIADGTVPATVASFSELHDYVDANYYGGAFEDGEAMHSVCNSSDADDTFGSGCDRCCDFWNDVQNAVDAWLKRGRTD
jgi:hypothetical protein